MTSDIQLEKVCLIVTDGTHASPIRTESGVPVLSAQNVKRGRLDFATTRYTNQTEMALFQRRVHPKNGDVMLTIVGTIGRSAVLRSDADFILQRSVAILRPDPMHVDSEYLKRAMDSTGFQAQLSSATNSSAQAGVYLGKLKKLTIPLPPLPEQRRIAAILDQADELCTKRRRALALLDELADTIYEQKMTPHASVPLSELCALRSGFLFKSSSWSSTGVPVIQISSVKDGFIDHTPLKFVSVATARTALRFELVRGDIVLAMTGNLGAVAEISEAESGFLLNQRVGRIEAISQHLVDAGYLYWALRMPETKRQMISRATGSAQANLSAAEFGKIRIPLPQMSEQRRIASHFYSLADLRRLDHGALAELIGLFASLQDRAFRGEL